MYAIRNCLRASKVFSPIVLFQFLFYHKPFFQFLSCRLIPSAHQKIEVTFMLNLKKDFLEFVSFCHAWSFSFSTVKLYQRLLRSLFRIEYSTSSTKCSCFCYVPCIIYAQSSSNWFTFHILLYISHIISHFTYCFTIHVMHKIFSN